MWCPASVVSSVSDDRGGDGPIRPTLHKTTSATKRARSLDNNIKDRNIRSAERVRAHISVVNPHPLPLRVSQLAFCSVGRIGPSPSHLFESARLHSHPLLFTPLAFLKQSLAFPGNIFFRTLGEDPRVKPVMKPKFFASIVLSAGIFLAAALMGATAARADETYSPFDGEKSVWHDGFERHDFVMDEETLAITPFKVPDGDDGSKDGSLLFPARPNLFLHEHDRARSPMRRRTRCERGGSPEAWIRSPSRTSL